MKKILIILSLVFVLISCWENKGDYDTTRVNDLMKIRTALELVYQDEFEYPTDLSNIQDLPKDPMKWEIINWCEFWYKYEKKWDSYKLSTCLEEPDFIPWSIDWKFVIPDSLNNKDYKNLKIKTKNNKEKKNKGSEFSKEDIDSFKEGIEKNRLNITSDALARDMRREQDLLNLENIIVMYQNFEGSNPKSLDEIYDNPQYFEKKNKFDDPMEWQNINWCKVWYKYEYISKNKFKITLCYESKEMEKMRWSNIKIVGNYE